MHEYKITIEVSAIIEAENEYKASEIFLRDYNENSLKDYIQLKIGYSDIKRIEKIK